MDLVPPFLVVGEQPFFSTINVPRREQALCTTHVRIMLSHFFFLFFSFFWGGMKVHTVLWTFRQRLGRAVRAGVATLLP